MTRSTKKNASNKKACTSKKTTTTANKKKKTTTTANKRAPKQKSASERQALELSVGILPRRFVYQDGASHKFWIIDWSRMPVPLGIHETMATWGKVGMTGQRKANDFDSYEAAMKHVAKKIQEKLRKGYQEEVVSSGRNVY